MKDHGHCKDVVCFLMHRTPSIKIEARNARTPDVGVAHEIMKTLDLLPELIDLERTSHQ